MTESPIRNKNILSKLNYVTSMLNEIGALDSFNGDSYVSYSDNTSKEELSKEPEKFLSEYYLKKHLADPRHAGYPVDYKVVRLKEFKTFTKEHINKLSKKTELYDKITKLQSFVKTDFVVDLGATSNALFAYYPTGGFVGWHTNQNNSGYQFLFSWSKDGDGYFQYYDKAKDKIIKIQDKPGWQCRHYHFGMNENDHCWHSAYTNSPRVTIAALFRWWDQPQMKEQVLEMKDQLIEEIESEY